MVTSLVRELLTLAVHVWWSVGRRPRDPPRRGRVHEQPALEASGRKYLGDTSNVLCPGGQGTDCEGLVGLEKCDPGSPLEEAVNDQDGATVGERGVDGRKLAPGHVVEKEKERDEVGQPCRYCIVLLQVEKLVSLPAGPSSLPQRE